MAVSSYNAVGARSKEAQQIRYTVMQQHNTAEGAAVQVLCVCPARRSWDV
jgi:hypothetical protein